MPDKVLFSKAGAGPVSNEWQRLRVEYAPLENPDGPSFAEMRRFEGNELVDHRMVYGRGGTTWLGCIVKNGRAAIDSFVVREMVPLGDTGDRE